MGGVRREVRGDFVQFVLCWAAFAFLIACAGASNASAATWVADYYGYAWLREPRAVSETQSSSNNLSSESRFRVGWRSDFGTTIDFGAAFGGETTRLARSGEGESRQHFSPLVGFRQKIPLPAFFQGHSSLSLFGEARYRFDSAEGQSGSDPRTGIVFGDYREPCARLILDTYAESLIAWKWSRTPSALVRLRVATYLGLARSEISELRLLPLIEFFATDAAVPELAERRSELRSGFELVLARGRLTARLAALLTRSLSPEFDRDRRLKPEVIGVLGGEW